MTEEIQKIIAHCLEYAKELLEDTGEFYPFGAYIGNEGNVHPLEYEFDKKNMPTNGRVIEWLENFCKEELENKRINSYCITYDVNIQLEENKPGTDAVCFDIKDPAEPATPLLYIPYKVDKQAKPVFEAMFAVKR
jgi:hypothetical protein